LEEIVARARQVDALASSLASASGEQSHGVKQVNLAVSQIGKVTQQNAASAEESASAAEELSAQSELMKASVAELLRLVNGGQTQAVAPASHAPASKTTLNQLRPKSEWAASVTTFEPPRRTLSNACDIN
jgi:hypothetical protein